MHYFIQDISCNYTTAGKDSRIIAMEIVMAAPETQYFNTQSGCEKCSCVMEKD
jgi:hypothetical protein